MLNRRKDSGKTLRDILSIWRALRLLASTSTVLVYSSLEHVRALIAYRTTEQVDNKHDNKINSSSLFVQY